jgi:hypothetical protein
MTPAPQSATTCAALHQLALRGTLHRFPYDRCSVPRGGIYVLFEVGEQAVSALCAWAWATTKVVGRFPAERSNRPSEKPKSRTDLQ